MPVGTFEFPGALFILEAPMLTGRIATTLDIPGEPNQTVTIRKMSHHMLMIAIDGVDDRAIEKFTKLGDSAKHLSGLNLNDDDPEKKKAAEEAAKLPANKYDRLTVLRYGVTAWTYEEATKPTWDDESKMWIGGVADLDEDTATWLFDEIITFSLRSATDTKASAGASPRTTPVREAAGLLS